jgi:membrane-bound lytic murein transglycosylase D
MKVNKLVGSKTRAIALEANILHINIRNKNQANKTQRNKMTALAAAWVLAAGLVYSISVQAETNAAGVEIEYINESELAKDAVENLLADMDSAHENDMQADTHSDLWARIKDGYELPDVNSPLTSTHEEWYASRPDYVKRMVERSQRYMFHIVEEVQKRGMPTEIALLPMIESAFNPQAYSRSKASGIWQFMPATGKHFGLQQNWWADNRRDVTAATNAALDYLQKLYGMFGSWDLALAAYNAGEGTVQRAIDKNKNLGLATDYKSLNLPPETRNYVPKLQAVKNIITEPEKYGLTIAAMPNRPYFARVTTPKQIDAKLAAQLAEISYEEFSALNPSYNRPVITSTITSSGEKNQLLLPVWAAERFVKNLANYDKPLTSWQTYNAKRGEHVDSIAKRFGTNASQLRTANGFTATGKLRNPQTMLVPAVYSASAGDDEQAIDAIELENNHVENSTEVDEPKTTDRVIYKVKTHRVKKGENLTALAAKYDTSTQALMKMNGLKNAKVKVGQSLKVNDGFVNVANFKSAKINTTKTKVTHTKLNSNKKTIKSKYKPYKRIRARSNIRLR